MSGLAANPLHATARLAAELDRRAVPLSLLITPKRLLGAPEVTGWLRGRAADGDALLLHGFDRPASRPRPAWWPPVGVTGLPAHETGLQLVAARAALGQLDLAVTGFAPPGWLIAGGTLNVLRRNGFEVCVEMRGVHDLASGALLPGRLLGFGRGQRTEPWFCRAAVLGAARAARLDRLVQLTVSAADLDRPGVAGAVLDAVDIALHHDARPTTYPGLFRPTVPSQRTGSGSGHRRTIGAAHQPTGPQRVVNLPAEAHSAQAHPAEAHSAEAQSADSRSADSHSVDA